MHCPSCGNESSLDQKFCRKCGFNLEPVAKLITTDTRTDELEPQRAEAERALVRRMFRWVYSGSIVVLAAVMLLVLNRGFFHAGIFVAIASLFFLAGGSIVMYGIVSSILKGTHLTGKTSKSPAQINQSSPTRELPESRDPAFVPSVTERTTQLIGDQSKSNP